MGNGGYTLGERAARQVADAIRKINGISISGGSGIQSGSGALTTVTAMITGNLTGGGYYSAKQLQFPTSTSDITGSSDLAQADIGDLATAANVIIQYVAEVGTTAHSLSVNTIVTGILRRVNSDGKLVVAVGSASASVWVYVDSAAAGGGKYNGRLALPPTSNLSATGTLSLADLATVSTVNVLIFNAAEQGQNTHDLTDATPRQKIFHGAIIGTSSDSPSVPVVRIGSVDAGDCSAGAGQ